MTYNITLIGTTNAGVEGHIAGCADVAKAKNLVNDSEPWTFEVDTKQEAYEAYNSDFLAEEPDGSSSYDINWLPCAKAVPAGASPEPKQAGTVSVRGVEFKACGCGCGEPVGKRSDYRPGHDARHAGQVARDAVDAFRNGQGAVDSDEFYTVLDGRPLLQAKARAMAVGLVTKKAKAPKAPKAQSSTGEIKIGRWTYPVRLTNAGKPERNTKRDGSGSWEPVNANAAQNIDWS